MILPGPLPTASSKGDSICPGGWGADGEMLLLQGQPPPLLSSPLFRQPCPSCPRPWMPARPCSGEPSAPVPTWALGSIWCCPSAVWLVQAWASYVEVESRLTMGGPQFAMAGWAGDVRRAGGGSSCPVGLLEAGSHYKMRFGIQPSEVGSRPWCDHPKHLQTLLPSPCKKILQRKYPSWVFRTSHARFSSTVCYHRLTLQAP